MSLEISSRKFLYFNLSGNFYFRKIFTKNTVQTFQITVRDISAPPSRRHRLGATVSALTVLALGLLGAGTLRPRRFGAGRFGATLDGDSH